MGSIISRFRHKKSMFDILKTIENDIEKLEQRRMNNLELSRKVVGRLMFFSFLVYILLALLLLFFYLPTRWFDRVFYAIPLTLVPLLLWGARRLLKWWFVRQSLFCHEKLVGLKKRRKVILEEVMERETYKSALDILERFDPEYKKDPKQDAEGAVNFTAIKPGSVKPSPGVPGVTDRPNTSPLSQKPTQQMGTVPRITSRTPVILPRPVLPRHMKVMDRMIDYLVGDGPMNRYALICLNCAGHNGMALKEEFEYLAFRCAYCQHFHPPRKQRPIAPNVTINRSLVSSCGDNSDELSASLMEGRPLLDLHKYTKDVIKTDGKTEEGEQSQSSVFVSQVEEILKPCDVETGGEVELVAPFHKDETGTAKQRKTQINTDEELDDDISGLKVDSMKGVSCSQSSDDFEDLCQEDFERALEDAVEDDITHFLPTSDGKLI